TQARKVARELLKRANAIVKHAQTLDDANRIRVEALHAVAGELTEMRSLAQGIELLARDRPPFIAPQPPCCGAHCPSARMLRVSPPFPRCAPAGRSVANSRTLRDDERSCRRAPGNAAHSIP